MSAWEAAGQSDEWYTPAYIFDALACVFDLDVAAPYGGGPHVPCLAHFHSFGLERDWTGFVWMNPPYGGRNSLTPWLDKFISHGDGLALVPDRTSAPWFQKAAPRMHEILFVREKIKFIRPDGSIGKQPGTGSALMAIGGKGVRALSSAAHLGFRALVPEALDV